MPNGLSIKNREDAQRLYEDDPGLAFGVLFENIADIKITQLEHIKHHHEQFSAQVAICSGRFVKKSHLVIVGALALGIGLGAGWLTVNEVLAIAK